MLSAEEVSEVAMTQIYIRQMPAIVTEVVFRGFSSDKQGKYRNNSSIKLQPLPNTSSYNPPPILWSAIFDSDSVVK